MSGCGVQEGLALLTPGWALSLAPGPCLQQEVAGTALVRLRDIPYTDAGGYLG
jgi:hypothetical protein